METFGTLTIYMATVGIFHGVTMQKDVRVATVRHVTHSKAQELINEHNKQAREMLGGNTYRYEFQQYSEPMEPSYLR